LARRQQQSETTIASKTRPPPTAIRINQRMLSKTPPFESVEDDAVVVGAAVTVTTGVDVLVKGIKDGFDCERDRS
jgi:hypothetical protein